MIVLRNLILTCGAAWMIAAACPADAATPRPLTIERLYSLPSIIGTRPENPQWSPDSRRLAFLWNDEGTNFRDVWIADARGGKPVRITSMPRPENPPNPGSDVAQLQRVARAESDPGVSELVWAPDGRHLVFVVHGALYQVLPGQPAQRLGSDDTSASQIAASIRARSIAYLSAGNLWTADLAGSKPAFRKIRSRANRDVEVESFVWSDDGARLAFIETDASQVPTRGIPDYLGESSRLIDVKRPYPGEPSESRRLGVVATSGGDVQWMDLGDNLLEPIFGVRWSPDGTHLLVDKSDLYVKDRRLLVLDVDTGRSHALVREINPKNVTAEWWAEWAPDGRGVYFTSDRDNDYHVYFQSLEGGEPKAMTAGPWAVFSASLSPAAHALFVVTNAGNAESRRVSRVPLDGGPPELLTQAEGAHRPSVSPDGTLLADLHSNDVTPPDLYLQSANRPSAKAPIVRQVTHSPVPEFTDYHWVAAKYVVFPNVNDGTPLHARLTLPPDFDPAKKYPAILGLAYSNTVHDVSLSGHLPGRRRWRAGHQPLPRAHRRNADHDGAAETRSAVRTVIGIHALGALAGHLM
ncbi:MAG: DPP IV N-terminal domain-containing protein, partial [Dokdonella sp.]|uniref:DPP IV N-terminal domain-containing protein n=1 Tax=Dokdonella sp. TaxID=2291710 RepID=UPI003264D339